MANLQIPTTVIQNVNDALAGLATLNESTGWPTAASLGLASLAGVVAHNLSTDQIGVRDQADSTWIILGTLDEVNKTFRAAVAAGAGLTLDSNGNLAVKLGPTSALAIDASGDLVVNFAAAGGLGLDASGALEVKLAANEAVALDASGNLMVKLAGTEGMAQDASGNVYVKLAPAGGLAFDAAGELMMKLAAAGGLALDASGNLMITLKAASGLALDASGNLMVTLTPNGGLAFDASGNLGIKPADNSVILSSVGLGAALGFRNRLINGDFQVSQYNGANAVTPSPSPVAAVYAIDRWALGMTQTGKLTVQQIPGFGGSLGAVKITTAAAYSPLATDYFAFSQNVEAQFVADWQWGTANAKDVTLSFLAQASVAGTYGGSIQQVGGGQSFPFVYTVPQANTPTQLSVTIPGPTTGTWATGTNGIFRVVYDLGSGANWHGSASSWQTGNLLSATGAASLVATQGATLSLTNIQLEAGRSATSFETVPFDLQLLRCQRYFAKTFPYSVAPATNTGLPSPLATIGMVTSVNAPPANWTFPVRMRDIPTITTFSPADTSTNWGGTGVARIYLPALASGPSALNEAGVSISTWAPDTVYGLQYQIHATASAEL